MIFAATAIAVVLSAGLAQAADQRNYEFSGTPNTVAHLEGTSMLVGVGEGNGVIALPANQKVTWVAPVELAAAAPFADGDFGAQLFLSNPTGSVTVLWGYWVPNVGPTGGHFEPLKSGSANVQRVPRAIIPGTLSLPTTGTQADIGRVIVTQSGVSSEIPAHTYPAIQLLSTAANSLYTQPSNFQASASSSATIPMPELPAIALLGLGVAVVAGTVIYRRRQGWN